MRRPLIKPNKKMDVTVTQLTSTRTKVTLDGPALDKRLRQKRTKEYIESMTQLDAGGVKCSHATVEELLEGIKSEFSDIEPYQYPIGIIARCYLGDSYEVHTLDTKLDIIEHFKRGEGLPLEMGRGKTLALHPSYEFIEIYSDTLRAVTSNGDVSVIKG